MPSTPSRSFVAYVRVSTERQGRSGLGLEAQEAAIRSFLQPGDRLLAPVFVEVESGRKHGQGRSMIIDADDWAKVRETWGSDWTLIPNGQAAKIVGRR